MFKLYNCICSKDEENDILLNAMQVLEKKARHHFQSQILLRKLSNDFMVTPPKEQLSLLD